MADQPSLSSQDTQSTIQSDEWVARRTITSKSYINGDGSRTLVQSLGAIHYINPATKRLSDIDLTLVDYGTEWGIDKAPYTLRIDKALPKYTYISGNGTQFSAELLAPGAVPLGNIDGECVWDLGNGDTYIISPRREGCTTKLKLNSAQSPHIWQWQLGGDDGIMTPVIGLDAELNRCEVISATKSGILTVEVTGNVYSRRDLRQGTILQAVYPIIVDPTVTEAIVVNTDNCWSASLIYTGTPPDSPYAGVFSPTIVWQFGYTQTGSATVRYWGGARFQSVAIASGTTISSAVFRYWVFSSTGSTNCNIYAVDVDSAAAFSSGSSATRMRNVARTTAFTPITTHASNAASPVELNVTTAIQEVLSRTGWTTGNNIALVAVPISTAQGGDSAIAYNNPFGSSLVAQLSITYTGAANVPTAAYDYRMRRVP